MDTPLQRTKTLVAGYSLRDSDTSENNAKQPAGWCSGGRGVHDTPPPHLAHGRGVCG